MPDETTKKPADETTKKPAKAVATEAAEPEARNLTREQLELTLRAKLIEQGKSEAEADAESKRRARQMIG